MPGVGHFGATAFLDDAWRREIRGRGRRRRAAPRHLPGTPVAVRGKRRSAAPGARRPAGALRAAPADREGAARRLELARDHAAIAAARRRARGHAGVLHALVRRAGHRRLRRGDDARDEVRRGRATGQRVGRSVPPGEVGTRRLEDSGELRDAGSRAAHRERRAADRSHAVQTHHRLPRRPRRLGRQGDQFRRAAARRRSRGARRALQRRGHRRAGDPRRHRNHRRTTGARGDDSRGVGAAVHPARGRRRHPRRVRRRGGDRRRRRQGQHQLRRALRPVARHHAGRALRQPGGRRRRSMPSRTASASRCSREAARSPPTATPSNGRSRPRRGAPARSSSPRSTATAHGPDSTATLTAAVSSAVVDPRHRVGRRRARSTTSSTFSPAARRTRRWRRRSSTTPSTRSRI